MGLRKLLGWTDDEVTGGKVPQPPTLRPRPQVPAMSIQDLDSIANKIAESKMFGKNTTPQQAFGLMLLCQAEGLHPITALRRYHIIEGKPSYRADALQGEFEQTGAILWHERNDHECSATFFKDKRQATAEAQERAFRRYTAIKEGQSLAPYARIGEVTIVRTLQDAIDKKLAVTWDSERRPPQWVKKKNWEQSPRQMLHARCLSEGVTAIDPGLKAGIYVEDEEFDHEGPTEEYPERLSDEEKVKQATANRERADRAEHEARSVTVEILAPLTLENCEDVECHVGEPTGPMFGRKLGKLHPNILEWLEQNFGTKWGVNPTEKDGRLFEAVRMVLKKLRDDDLKL